MAKYKEVMDHIKVTDEMRSRILQNTEKHFERKKTSRRRVWVPVLGTVAAAAVLLLAIGLWKGRTPSVLQDPSSIEQDPPSVAVIFDEKIYSSLEELSAGAGFAVPEITRLPFEVRETVWRSYAGNAETSYIGEKETLCFIMSAGTEDNSGDYNTYSNVKTVPVGETNVTLKGEGASVRLAVWTDGSYSYSIADEAGLGEEDVLEMIREIMK